jgi:hypothetical protein
MDLGQSTVETEDEELVGRETKTVHEASLVKTGFGHRKTRLAESPPHASVHSKPPIAVAFQSKAYVLQRSSNVRIIADLCWEFASVGKADVHCPIQS